MAVDNIKIVISDAELEATKAKLDVMLEKKTKAADIKEVEEGIAALEQRETVLLSVGTKEALYEVEEIEDRLVELRTYIATVRSEAEHTKGLIDSSMSTADEISELARMLPDVGREQRLIITQVPGLREALNLMYKTKMLLGGSLELGAIALAIYTVKSLLDEFDRRQRKAKEYESLVREYRHFTTHKEFEAWQNQQRQIREDYRSQPI